MSDRRLTTLIYAAFVLVVCVTLWQLKEQPENTSTMAVYASYFSNHSFTYPTHSLLLGDYHQLIDLNNFTFNSLPLPCNDSKLLLLILVHSHPKNYDIRKTIRETWGQNSNQVKLVFMTGQLKNTSLKDDFDKENEEHGDLVQGSFMDAYRNMTYKHVMAFKYAIYHCPQAKYVLKTDDDVFVNMPFLMNFLTQDLPPFHTSGMLLCSVLKKSRVIRSYRSKWRVSFKEYPGRNYPPYCLGWAILYSPDVLFKLYKEAQRTEYFWIDDVHITGTIAHKTHVTQVNVNNFILSRTHLKLALRNSSRFRRSFLYGPPDVKKEEIVGLWNYVQNQNEQVSLRKDIS